MKKILYVIESLTAGGKERRLIELIKGIKNSASVSIKLIILTDVVHYKEVHSLDLELVILKRVIKKDPTIFLKLFKICKRWSPDIIHVWGTMSSIYVIPIAKVLNIKLINSMIADAPSKLNFSLALRSKLSLLFSDVILANSYAGLISYGYQDKGVVIYNGFDMKRLQSLKNKSDIKRRLNIKTQFIIGMVAAFRDHKDYMSFIDAAILILEKKYNVTFLCVGDGPLIEIIRGKTKNEKIKFLGNVDDVLSIINTFDISVLLTNLDKHGEGISNVIMESMALGIPVIATKGGGTKEIINDYKNGFLIPHKSPVSLVDRIELILNNPDLKNKISEVSKNTIKNNFSIKNMISKHLKVYDI